MGEHILTLLDTDVPTIPKAFVCPLGDVGIVLSPHYKKERDEMPFQEMVKAGIRKPPKFPIHNKSCDQRITTLRRHPNLSSRGREKLIEIAAAGFFSTGNLIDGRTTLTCYHCGAHATDWRVDDDPWSRHVELQPLCPVIARHIDHNKQLPMAETVHPRTWRRSVSSEFQ